jgi:hypothetical protein
LFIKYVLVRFCCSFRFENQIVITGKMEHLSKAPQPINLLLVNGRILYNIYSKPLSDER